MADNIFGDTSVVATAETMTTDPARLLSVHAANLTTADAYLQLFDALIANVTVGTTVPDQIFLVPAGNGTLAGALIEEYETPGARFITGIAYAATTTPTGNTAPATGITLTAGYD